MQSKVYWIDFRAKLDRSILDKFADLMVSAGMKDVVEPKKLIAVKLHFGERGNTAYVRPVFVRKAVELMKELKGRPFLTDANTLYRGQRDLAPKHIECAIGNGFDYSSVGAPIIIADGIKGTTAMKVKVNLKRFSDVTIGAEVYNSDAIVSIAHFKLHELLGFGGALKNVGMGCAARAGKLAQHSTIAPYVFEETCEGCKTCLLACGYGAVRVRGAKAYIIPEKCIGCGECIGTCPTESIRFHWDVQSREIQEKMMEYVYGVLSNKKNRALFVNFISHVTPLCDCYEHSDAPIVPDVGIFASQDPVAVDLACVEAINDQIGLSNSALKSAFARGTDKIRDVHPKIDWRVQLEYAEKLGIGSTKYELVKID